MHIQLTYFVPVSNVSAISGIASVVILISGGVPTVFVGERSMVEHADDGNAQVHFESINDGHAEGTKDSQQISR